MTPDQDPSTKVSGAPASGPRTVIGVDGGVAVEQLVISSDDDPRRMTRFDLAPPRHFVFPAVLLLLSEEPSYGYELVKGLRAFRFGTVDRPAVYRALAQLEKDGLVESRSAQSKAGTARRVYGLTEDGEVALRRWMGVMKEERDGLDRVLRRYRATATPQALLADAGVRSEVLSAPPVIGDATASDGAPTTGLRVVARPRRQRRSRRGGAVDGSDVRHCAYRVLARPLGGAHRGPVERRADHVRRPRHHRHDRGAGGRGAGDGRRGRVRRTSRSPSPRSARGTVSTTPSCADGSTRRGSRSRRSTSIAAWSAAPATTSRSRAASTSTA